MPAVMIRQLDSLVKVAEQTPDRSRRTILIREAERIQRASARSVVDADDRADVTRAYHAVIALVSTPSA
ncbi:hypothetical protein MAUB1S_02038 [Mycolicibacterium aubagnense]